MITFLVGTLKLKTTRCIALVVLAAIGMVACDSGDGTLIEAPTLQQVRLEPATVTLALGQTQQFRVVGHFSDGSVVDLPASYSATGGVITAAGLFTATSLGNFTIIATPQGGGAPVTASVTVSNTQTLQRVILTPDTARVQTSGTFQFQVAGQFSDNSTGPITATYTATGGTISATGQYVAGAAAGTFRVIAQSTGGLADTSVVIITAAPPPPPTLVSISLSPPLVTLQTGAQQQYQVMATYSDNATANVTSQATFTVTGGSVAGGLYTAGNTPGTYQVSVSFQGRTANATVNIVPALLSIALQPASVTLQTGGTQQFRVIGQFSNGTADITASAVFTATGGTITSAGNYSAGNTAGNYQVAAAAFGFNANASVTISAPAPAPVNTVTITGNTTIAQGATSQLTAVLRDAAGNVLTGRVVTWSSSNTAVATVANGLVTGVAPGTATITATSEGRSGTTNITVPTPTPPPPPGQYTVYAGDDWHSYTSVADMKAKQQTSGGGFWWYITGDPYQYVSLQQDPTFGQVVRTEFPQTDLVGYAPKYAHSFSPISKLWFRFRMKYTPGWTSVGPNPPGHANSYKVAFWMWEQGMGWGSRGQIELSNTDEYIVGMGVSRNGTYVRYNETSLPGSTSWGNVTTEWSDGEWWEFVVYYQKTSTTSARQYLWKRRLTQGGTIVNNSWHFIGWEYTGAETPRVGEIRIGETKNKSNPHTMYISWGPWEVVDGDKFANPWGMPNVIP